MVQQTIDSKFSGYRLAHTETGLLKHDKQQRVPLAAKNENMNMVPKSGASSHNLKESGPVVDTLKVSSASRTQSECLVKPSRYQSPPNIVNGHLVYVRRKPQAKFRINNTSEKTTNWDDSAQSKQHDVQDEKFHQQSHVKDSRNCPSEAEPVAKASSGILLSTKPSISLPHGKPHIVLPPAETNVNVNVIPAISSLDHSKRSRVQNWDERYARMQNLLKVLDQSNQEDYLQKLRSLSSVELSRVAVELEKRSIHLSLEEAREMHRVKVLDVLGKNPRNTALTQHDPSSDKHGGFVIP